MIQFFQTFNILVDTKADQKVLALGQIIHK